MEIPLAYCGLRCDKCPVHLATLEQNGNRRFRMREIIAEECSRLYKRTFLQEDITDCDGCRSASGRLLNGCRNCEIRKCAIEKKLDSCAFCPDYLCEVLRKHLVFEKSAKERLEAMRAGS